MRLKQKKIKIQNKDKIELEQVHLSYVVFTRQPTFLNAFQNYEFNNNIRPETFVVIYIFVDLVYLHAFGPIPILFYPHILARDQEFLTGPQNAVYGEIPL